jgi:pimeloyl-ACP methyl ester carboxylesterase
MGLMARTTLKSAPVLEPIRVRRGYFECRFGQLHLHNAMPPGGGFEEGTPLLCLHDVPGSARAFAPLLTLAARERSVYAPDLPGCGESDGPTGPAALADYAHALGDFLDSMRLRSLDILGVRGGALLAAELALERGAQVGRLVMLSVPLPKAGERSPLPPPAAELPESQRSLLEALERYPARERLARLTQKLLVLRAHDELSESTARIRDVLPGSRVMEIEGGARELLAAQPARLLEAVRDFLRG